MNYLHWLHIIHGDLKGVSLVALLLFRSNSHLTLQKNILIGDDGKALIADFGLSLFHGHLLTEDSSGGGTQHWMAPEVLSGEPPGLPSDVYSYAITAWELYTGTIPFRGERGDLLEIVAHKKERPSRPGTLDSDILWSIIEDCWHPIPSKRPEFPWLHANIKPLIEAGNVTPTTIPPINKLC
jgi:serine/threonine protein kinase